MDIMVFWIIRWCLRVCNINGDLSNTLLNTVKFHVMTRGRFWIQILSLKLILKFKWNSYHFYIVTLSYSVLDCKGWNNNSYWSCWLLDETFVGYLTIHRVLYCTLKWLNMLNFWLLSYWNHFACWGLISLLSSYSKVVLSVSLILFCFVVFAPR